MAKASVSLFSCRAHLNFIIALLGTLKVGAVVGPLFEAFMETAVRDRLEDSEAVAIVTTPAYYRVYLMNELASFEACHSRWRECGAS